MVGWRLIAATVQTDCAIKAGDEEAMRSSYALPADQPLDSAAAANRLTDAAASGK